jgi:hypothetical protein
MFFVGGSQNNVLCSPLLNRSNNRTDGHLTILTIHSSFKARIYFLLIETSPLYSEAKDLENPSHTHRNTLPFLFFFLSYPRIHLFRSQLT